VDSASGYAGSAIYRWNGLGYTDVNADEEGFQCSCTSGRLTAFGEIIESTSRYLYIEGMHALREVEIDKTCIDGDQEN
jgi:hypothetical protein